MECLANYTLKVCGCVKFSMPRDAKTPICGAAKISCYTRAESLLLVKTRVQKITQRYSLKPVKVRSCNCLPACTSITYDTEILQAPFEYVSFFSAFKAPLHEFPGYFLQIKRKFYGHHNFIFRMQPARLLIFFKESEFSTAKRSELYTPSDFLANCGGLLGLFIGASFLSIVELLYFLSLRLWCNLQVRNKHKQKNVIDDPTMTEIFVVKTAPDKIQKNKDNTINIRRRRYEDF